MRRFSTLAGPFEKLGSAKSYNVQYRNVIGSERTIYRVWTRILSYGGLLLVFGFALFLMKPSHWIITQLPDSPTFAASVVMLVCLSMLLIFLIIGSYSATRSTLKAKDPYPVLPPRRLKVAFATTRAPGEPVDMVRTTLIAAKAIHYKSGTVHVWLLDETDDPELRSMTKELGVRYFTRKGIERWNTPKPQPAYTKRFFALVVRCLTLGIKKLEVTRITPDPYLAAKSKHGNFNSWRQYLREQNMYYDILAGVDTDQVPEPNYLNRLLGYFRDEDVAYVVGPQVYGNYAPGLRGLVARWAESQASFFQSTIQRAGNASESAMFVGTNYAVRMRVLDQIGGFQPCITEDMATGLAIHSKKNPSTGNRWKSVYTPDVLAVGEGPDFWGPYFTQQWRWAAGTFDTWRKSVWRVAPKLPKTAMLHYFLMLTYYPMTALTWLLGIVSSMTYLVTGATAILAPWGQFLSLYLMLVVMQLSLYFWNRRYNVSPHEPEGSFGVSGMAISTIAAPIYLSALFGIIIGKKATFVVTTKGSSDNPDWFPAFKTHLQWAALLLAGLSYGIWQGHTHPAMLVWTGVLLFICFVPFVLGMALAAPPRIRSSSIMKILLPVGESQNAS